MAAVCDGAHWVGLNSCVFNVVFLFLLVSCPVVRERKFRAKYLVGREILLRHGKTYEGLNWI